MATENKSEPATRLVNGKLIPFALYFLISLVLFGVPVISDPGHLHIGYFTDPAMMMWYIGWWPHAIWHGLDPFITHAVWPQTGYNLAWATSMPAVAVAMAPVTAAFGPVVAYNLASLIAPALSAWAAFVLCRHLTRGFGSAFAGGLIYGLSPYQAAQVIGGHTALTFGLVAPLCVLIVLLLLEKRIGTCWFVAGLAALLTLQCLIWTEGLATMTVFGAAALLLAIVILPEYQRRLIAAALAIAVAYLAAVIILAPFWYYAFVIGSAPSAPIFPTKLFSADLLSFIVPGQLTLVHQLSGGAVISRFAGNIWENGSYIGIPLLLIAAIWQWQHRREQWSWWLSAVLVVVMIAELGPVLQVERRPILTLPWALAARLPLLQHALPVRFANYSFLIMAIIFSSWLADPDFPFKKILTGVTFVSLVPVATFFLPRSTYETPSFFANGIYRHYLHPDENVLIIPYGRSGPSMAWQAQSGMYFRMPGGHLSTTPEDFRRWPIVNALVNSLPLPDPAGQLRAFAAFYGIDAIVVADNAKGSARALPASLGIPPTKIGGVLLYRLPSGHDARPTVVDLERFQVASAEQWFQEMLCAGQRFVANGGNLPDLNPSKAYALGLLPYSDWCSDFEFLLAGLPHNAYNGLWVGPGAGGTIAVGVPASGVAARALAARYRTDAASVLYPYPEQYTGAAPTDDTMRFLLIEMRPGEFRDCSSLPPELPSTSAR
jgi:hypothetical protein